jgi:hypothetical protein
MEMKVKMPPVSKCTVSDCGYNKDSKCHARAITIGDGDRPMCDTFFESEAHAKGPQLAGVGACKVSCCMHNTDFACVAEKIAVEPGDDMADCSMFEEE